MGHFVVDADTGGVLVAFKAFFGRLSPMFFNVLVGKRSISQLEIPGLMMSRKPLWTPAKTAPDSAIFSISRSDLMVINVLP